MACRTTSSRMYKRTPVRIETIRGFDQTKVPLMISSCKGYPEREYFWPWRRQTGGWTHQFSKGSSSPPLAEWPVVLLPGVSWGPGQIFKIHSKSIGAFRYTFLKIVSYVYLPPFPDFARTTGEVYFHQRKLNLLIEFGRPMHDSLSTYSMNSCNSRCIHPFAFAYSAQPRLQPD